MKKVQPKYVIGQQVKVDCSGSGNGVVFGKILDKVETKEHNPNNYAYYNIDSLEYAVCEYYIRPATKVDLKYKKLYDEKNIKDFDIDDDQIKKEFWKSQKEIIKTARNFINDFLYPYLKDSKHVVSIENITNWDKVYKKALHLKSDYLFVIPHENFNFIIQKNSTYITLFITCPSAFYKDEEAKILVDRSGIAIFNYCVLHSDDEYTEILAEITKEIINDLEKGFEKKYYDVWVDYKIVNKLELFENPLDALNGINYNMYKNKLPGYEYTRALFDLSVMKHSFFSWS